MALNIPLTQGPDGEYPLPFPGEVFVLTRDKMELHLKDDELNLRRLRGRLFVTSARMVFMPSDPSKAQGVRSAELPFRGVWEERFHQPIFGVNHLTASVQYYDGEPFRGALRARLDFPEGGVNTFLPVFNNVLRATRVQLQMEAAAAGVGGGYVPPPIADAPPLPGGDSGSADAFAHTPQAYMPGHNDAFVDPSDPSRIFTTQPAGEERREAVPSWSADVRGGAEGLRRRL